MTKYRTESDDTNDILEEISTKLDEAVILKEETFRAHTAARVMIVILGNTPETDYTQGFYVRQLVKMSVTCADALIDQLKQ
jgi:hypothetical protein